MTTLAPKKLTDKGKPRQGVMPNGTSLSEPRHTFTYIYIYGFYKAVSAVITLPHFCRPQQNIISPDSSLYKYFSMSDRSSSTLRDNPAPIISPAHSNSPAASTAPVACEIPSPTKSVHEDDDSQPGLAILRPREIFKVHRIADQLGLDIVNGNVDGRTLQKMHKKYPGEWVMVIGGSLYSKAKKSKSDAQARTALSSDLKTASVDAQTASARNTEGRDPIKGVASEEGEVTQAEKQTPEPDDFLDAMTDLRPDSDLSAFKLAESLYCQVMSLTEDVSSL